MTTLIERLVQAASIAGCFGPDEMTEEQVLECLELFLMERGDQVNAAARKYAGVKVISEKAMARKRRSEMRKRSKAAYGAHKAKEHCVICQNEGFPHDGRDHVMEGQE